MEVLNYQEQLSQRERERRGSIYLKCHDFKSINFRYHFKSKNFKGLKSLVDLSKFKSLTFLESVCYSFEKGLFGKQLLFTLYGQFWDGEKEREWYKCMFNGIELSNLNLYSCSLCMSGLLVMAELYCFFCILC